MQKKREKNKTFKKFQSYQVGFLGNKKPEIGKVIFSIANNLTLSRPEIFLSPIRLKVKIIDLDDK